MMCFIMSSIAVGSPHRSFTSQGLAPTTTKRPCQSSAHALPIVTTNITTTAVATLTIALIVRNLPEPGVNALRYPRRRRPRRVVRDG